MPPHLLLFGLGYSARAVAALALPAGWRVSATSRDPDAAVPHPGVRLVAATADAVAPELASATHWLSSAPPDATGSDPILRLLAAAGVDASIGAGIGAGGSARPRWIGYLSTTGVYGDRGGGWVDEHTRPDPTGPRGRRRLRAERDWAALASRLGAPLDLFRLAGIYGPGRSVLDEVRAGRARRVDAPGHCFGRIHRDDIAGAVLAAIARPEPPGAPPRVLNLSDDLPAESAAVIAEAARLLGKDPPPLVPLAAARERMGEMGRSFWNENRKVSSRLTRERLRRPWLFPTFREGLRAVLDAECRTASASADQLGDRVP
ncbi:MAG: SDR family NAD(P)-dependent oxidoreductase [Gluconacetobacter diazotrophicus]|nr:SDR family NAD(P)-dependent oxidoreductase [Gluconacetobacter diazotrophicus]